MFTAFTVFELLRENLPGGKSVMENFIFLCNGHKRNQYPYKHLRWRALKQGLTSFSG